MTKINQIIKGLDCCIHANDDGCEECPYIYEHPCQQILWKDAITLLRFKRNDVEKWYKEMNFLEFSSEDLYSLLHKIINELESRNYK